MVLEQHGPTQATFKKWLEDKRNEKRYPRNNAEDRNLIMGMVIKCADLSNAAKPWRESKVCLRFFLFFFLSLRPVIY